MRPFLFAIALTLAQQLFATIEPPPHSLENPCGMILALANHAFPQAAGAAPTEAELALLRRQQKALEAVPAHSTGMISVVGEGPYGAAFAIDLEQVTEKSYPGQQFAPFTPYPVADVLQVAGHLRQIEEARRSGKDIFAFPALDTHSTRLLLFLLRLTPEQLAYLHSPAAGQEFGKHLRSAHLFDRFRRSRLWSLLGVAGGFELSVIGSLIFGSAFHVPEDRDGGALTVEALRWSVPTAMILSAVVGAIAGWRTYPKLPPPRALLPAFEATIAAHSKRRSLGNGTERAHWWGASHNALLDRASVSLASPHLDSFPSGYLAADFPEGWRLSLLLEHGAGSYAYFWRPGAQGESIPVAAAQPIADEPRTFLPRYVPPAPAAALSARALRNRAIAEDLQRRFPRWLRADLPLWIWRLRLVTAIRTVRIYQRLCFWRPREEACASPHFDVVDVDGYQVLRRSDLDRPLVRIDREGVLYLNLETRDAQPPRWVRFDRVRDGDADDLVARRKEIEDLVLVLDDWLQGTNDVDRPTE